MPESALLFASMRRRNEISTREGIVRTKETRWLREFLSFATVSIPVNSTAPEVNGENRKRCRENALRNGRYRGPADYLRADVISAWAYAFGGQREHAGPRAHPLSAISGLDSSIARLDSWGRFLKFQLLPISYGLPVEFHRSVSPHCWPRRQLGQTG